MPRAVIAAAFAAALSAATVPAVPAGALDPRLAGLMEEGEIRMYNLEFDRADEVFAEICRDFPSHPAGHTMRGTAIWWQARYWYRVPDEAAAAEMSRHLDEGIRLAEALKDDPATQCEGAFFLGGALGVKAHWKLLTGNTFQSILSARAAVKVLTPLLSCTPFGDEACFGLGLYEYVASRLPWHKRWLSRFIIGGGADREEALLKLERAATRSRYIRHDAQFTLALFLTLQEPVEAERALKHARRLASERPDSPMAWSLNAQTLLYTGEFGKALEVADRSLRLGEDPGSPFVRERPACLYYRGVALIGLKRLPEAIDSFTAAAALPGPPAWITGSYLMRGCAHDLAGRRDRAIADYRRAGELDDPWGQVRRSSFLLERPCTREDFLRMFASAGAPGPSPSGAALAE